MSWRDWGRGSQVCHQSFIARRSIAPTYDLSFPFTADIDWEIRCLKKSQKNVRTGLVISNYLVDEGAYSRRNLLKTWWDRYRVLGKHFGILPNIMNHLLIFLRSLLS